MLRDNQLPSISTGSMMDDLELEGGLHNKLYIVPCENAEDSADKLAFLTKGILDGAIGDDADDADYEVAYTPYILYCGPADECLGVPNRIYDLTQPSREDFLPQNSPFLTDDWPLIDRYLKSIFEARYRKHLSIGPDCKDASDVAENIELTNALYGGPLRLVVLCSFPDLLLDNPDDGTLDNIKKMFRILADYAEMYQSPIVVTSNIEIDEDWVVPLNLDDDFAERCKQTQTPIERNR